MFNIYIFQDIINQLEPLFLSAQQNLWITIRRVHTGVSDYYADQEAGLGHLHDNFNIHVCKLAVVMRCPGAITEAANSECYFSVMSVTSSYDGKPLDTVPGLHPKLIHTSAGVPYIADTLQKVKDDTDSTCILLLIPSLLSEVCP